VRSGMTTGSQASIHSSATYATDLLNGESQTVVTRQQGKIVLSRAQVVTAPIGTPTTAGIPISSPVPSSLLMPVDRRTSRMTVGRSPLAQSSFTYEDIPEEQAVPSPFADSNATRSPVPALSKDDQSVRTAASGWNDVDSIASGIEASISSAKRVIIRSDGRLTSPTPGNRAQYTNIPTAHRLSFASEASSRADSILEAFPFVTPSLPSLPPSPMTIQTFRSTFSNQARSPQPRSPLSTAPGGEATDDEELAPPDRRGQGVSVYSAKSSASMGLGDYPVELHIDPPSSGGRSQLPSRASLDTVALSRDLSAFPLAFDEAKIPARDSYESQPNSSRETS
jgi:protein OPY2